jgi:hypothetical protein
MSNTWDDYSNREYLKQLLSHSTMRIVFTKRDGTERTLLCTRNMGMVPVENHPKGVKREAPDSLPVWSILDEGWRSFRFDTVKDVEAVQLDENNNPVSGQMIVNI